MVKKQTSTRNIAFNGYEFENDNLIFYASLNSATTDEIKKITKNQYSNIKLLDSTDYIKLKGKDIVDYTKTNKEALDEAEIFGYNNIIQNAAFNNESKDFYLFGAPYKMVFDNLQSYANCGVESALNILVSAGIMTIKDQNSTEMSFLKKVWDMGIAADDGKLGVLDKGDGATTAYDRSEILDLYGINSNVYNNYNNVNQLAKYIKDGYGVMLSVSSNRLWYGYVPQDENLDHTITIVGVVYENENPTLSETPIAFVIHDTGAQMTRFITTEDLKYVALYDVTAADNSNLSYKTSKGFSAIITQNPIKTSTDNTNATGDKNPNIIYGNSGNNIIKSLDGNDTINSNDGNDTVYGGNGNDFIYGGTGRDVIYGDAGDDTIYGENDNDTIYGGAGNDAIYGDNGKDVIYGGAGNDTIYGGDDRNVIWGDAGNDEIYGGSQTDRILGGAGNDKIDGGIGADVIIAGDGNDTIIANKGDDKIEVGNGNDILLLNNPYNDNDTIYSSSGSITIQYTYDINEYNIMPVLGYDIASNSYSLHNINTSTNSSIVLKDFFDYKKNKSLTTYMINNADSEDKKSTYMISATKSANAKVANASNDNKNKDISNLLFTTNKTGTTVTTSKKNDVVFMYNCPDIAYSEEEYTRKDKITYTGGKDSYYSFVGDTTYIVDFNEETNLAIGDGIFSVSKVKVDEFGAPYIYELEPSKNDAVIFSSNIDNIVFFFDIDNQGKTTSNLNLYALYKTDENINDIKSNMIDIAKVTRDKAGYVAMCGFFKEGKELGSGECYGNGLIEEIYTKENGKDELYSGLETKINSIKASVISWLEANNTYSNVFEALSSNELPENIDTLIQCYTQNV